MSTVSWRWTFGGACYEVDVPSSEVVDGKLYPCIGDVDRATRGALYAALCDGIDDPKTLRMSRRSIGLGKGASVAARLGMPVDAFVEMENNREIDGRASYVSILRAWLKKSNRGTFAVRRIE